MYFKITNKEENHRGLQYKDGIIEDILPFNDNPKDSCCKGGIYFTDAKNIFNFLEYGVWLRQVEIPEDAKYIKDPNKDGIKWRAEKLFFHPRKELFTADTFQLLIDNGADIHEGDNVALRYASNEGHIEVVKLLVKHGADIHARDNSSLRYAARYGHLEVVKHLIENGADIHAGEDYALRWAADSGYFEVVKYLVENGADIHAREDSAYSWSLSNGHTEVAEYLKSLNK